MTRLTLLLFFGILAVTVLTGGTGDKFLFVVVFLTLIVTITYLFRPRKYTIGAPGITVVMTLISRTFADVVSVARLEDAASFKYRVFGIGGLFAIVGRFTTASGDRITAYLTDETQGHVVEIRRAGGQRVWISPQDPEGFVSSWRNRTRT